jgi:predicted PurR-regulated permease PerM
MEQDRKKSRQIMWLMSFGALLVLVLVHSDRILKAIAFLYRIIRPFLYGGAIAFVLNIPMSWIERIFLEKWKGRVLGKFRRTISLVVSLLGIVSLVTVIVCMVLPQLKDSITEIGNRLPEFTARAQETMAGLEQDNPFLARQIRELKLDDIQWDNVMENVLHFLRNGAADMLSSTFNVVGSILSGIVDGIIAVVFAIYVLAQKERLKCQVQAVMQAYLPQKVTRRLYRVCGLLYVNFNNFITGQCLEAVILGSMFIVSMAVLRLPYPLVIGLLIGITALVPIVGAFVGCAIGVFLIFMENPFQALVFLILFLVLQQIEGKLIYPKVVGNFVGLPGIWMLVAITLGGSLFGVMGMLVFIPLAATAYSLLREDVQKRLEAKKGLNQTM